MGNNQLAEETGYNERLDADRQVAMEEKIASLIFAEQEDILDTRSEHENTADEPSFDEEECADLGRQLLRMVLAEFRPDLFDGGDMMVTVGKVNTALLKAQRDELNLVIFEAGNDGQAQRVELLSGLQNLLDHLYDQLDPITDAEGGDD